MQRRNRTEKLQSLTLAVVVVFSLFAATVTVSGPVGATVNDSDFEVTEDVVQSDDEITVEGTADSSTSEVTFLIQDPADDDVATTTRSVDDDGSFSVDIKLDELTYSGGDGELDEGDVTILADGDSSFKESDASDTFIVDDTKPSGTLDSPEDGAELTEHPTIDGTASDGTEVESVELFIQNDDGDYYDEDGEEFVDSETAVDADGTTDWEYNTSEAGLDSDGTYEVSIRVTDTADNTREVVVPHPDSDTNEVSYTVDSKPPGISSIDATAATDGGETVSDGDTVEVVADVTDETSGVDTVTVDASELGGDTNEALSAESGDTYTTTFEVDSPTAGDGMVDLTMTATDAFGNEQEKTKTDALELETSVAGVDNLSVDHDFVGIVKDDSKLEVTASGITDPQGNTISGPTEVDIRIAGTETTYTATVEDGELSQTVDPTEISTTAETDETTVEIEQADDGEATAPVELVHEAKDLEEGYQVAGTPMPAENLVFEDVNDVVTTYDPTAENGESEWVATDGETAGEGYYIEGNSDDARVGYLFASGVTEGPEARTLHEGWNLVGTSVDLAEQNKQSATEDLGGAVDVDGNNVEVWTRDEDQDLAQSDGSSGYEEDDGSTTVWSFEGYFVYIDDTEETRNVDILEYDAANRN
ncbi:Ig-like domain-containing protein [Salinibaculum salinum]|uniref:Ig-like domain-containing protein n=1 Tax=Salinibaculum salinum TaxID=3131996 RepID=UPI0030ECC7D5